MAHESPSLIALLRAAEAAIARRDYKDADEQLDEVEAELVARLSAVLESSPLKRGSELLAAIHEAPHDLALRQVYADFLSERGDLRGELINLQLQPERRSRARERELLAKHGVEWAGDVGRAFITSTWVFERGFLVAGRCRRSWSARFYADPGWALIERVQDMSADLIIELELPSLRSLRGDQAWAVFRRKRPLPTLERLASSWLRVDELSIAVLERGELLPKLRELDFGHIATNIERLARLFEGPFSERLARLELTLVTDASVVTARAFVLDRGAPLQVLVLRTHGFELEFHAVDDARLAGLRVRINDPAHDIAWLRDELGRLAEHHWRIRSVVVAEKLREPLREILTSFE